MSKYRYPGAQPFSTDQKDIFFGRKEDIENLYQLINLEKLVVLYAKSGLGKSSLLNAGIIPKLLKEDDYSPTPIRFGAFHEGKEETPLSVTKQILSQAHNPDTFLDQLIHHENSLWYHTKEQQYEKDGKLKLLLIFDQFEELFTYPEAAIEEFQKELSELMHSQIPQRFREVIEQKYTENTLTLKPEELEILHKPFEIKIVMAIRSDRMSLMNQLSSYFPSILKNCYELGALTPEQAEEAILSPAYKKGGAFLCPTFDYEDEAIEEMLAFLTREGNERIESFQLQILCQSIEQKVMNYQLPIITERDLGNVEEVYENYYDDQIKLLGDETTQKAARQLIEDGLIFEEEERRLSLYEGQIFTSYYVTPELLRKLIDAHLLRAEPSMKGGYTYELSHDTLVGPVLRSKERRIQELEKIEAEKERQRKEKELEEARQQAIEERKKRQNARFAVIGFLLAAISLIATGFAFNQYKKAKAAESEALAAKLNADKNAEQAEQQRVIAEHSKNEAIKSAEMAEEQRLIALAAGEEAKRSAFLADLERQKALEAQKYAESQTKLATSNGRAALAHQFKTTNPTYALRLAESALDAAKDNERATEVFKEIVENGETLLFEKEIDTYEKISAIDTDDEKRFFATGNEAGIINLWSSDGVLQSTKIAHFRPITTVQFSPDGKYMISGSTDGTIKFWKVKNSGSTLELASTITLPNTAVHSAIFSPDGKYILAGGGNGAAYLHHSIVENNENSGKLVRKFTGHLESDKILDLAFSQNGKYLLTGSGDNTARLWSIEGILLRVFDDANSGGKNILSVAFYPDNQEKELIILTGRMVDVIDVWRVPVDDLQSSKTIATPDTSLYNHKGQICQIDFINSRGRPLLTTATSDGQLQIWKFNPYYRPWGKDTTQIYVSLLGSCSAGFSGNVQFCQSSTDQSIISTSRNGKIHFWPVEGNNSSRYYQGDYKAFIESRNIAPLGLSLTQRQNYEMPLDAPHLQPKTISGYFDHIYFFEKNYGKNNDIKYYNQTQKLLQEVIDWQKINTVSLSKLLLVYNQLTEYRASNPQIEESISEYSKKLNNYLASESALTRVLNTNESNIATGYIEVLEQQLEATQPNASLQKKIKAVNNHILQHELWTQNGTVFYKNYLITSLQKGYEQNKSDENLNLFYQKLVDQLTGKRVLSAFTAEELEMLGTALSENALRRLYKYYEPIKAAFYAESIKFFEHSLEKDTSTQLYLKLADTYAGGAFSLVYQEKFQKAVEYSNKAITLAKPRRKQGGREEEEVGYTNLVTGYLFSGQEDEAFDLYQQKWKDPYWRPQYDNFKGVFIKDLEEFQSYFSKLLEQSKEANDTEAIERYNQYLSDIDDALKFLEGLKE